MNSDLVIGYLQSVGLVHIDHCQSLRGIRKAMAESEHIVFSLFPTSQN
jgi:hypothetical protein